LGLIATQLFDEKGQVTNSVMRKRETRMGNRTAKFISALIGSIVAGAPLAAVSQNAPSAPNASSTANAAADCLASPKGAAPQGQHWHYRLERGTKRQCWYLRAEGSKVTQSAQAATDTPNADSSTPPSVQNAHAEYLAPQNGIAASAPTMTAPAPATTSAPLTQQPPSGVAASAQQPAVAARWPDASAASAAPAPQPSPAPVVTAAVQPAKPPAPMALASADSAADKPAGSFQMLLLVIGGALALAGILASVVYRFASPRVRVQAADRRMNWDDWEPHRKDGGRAPWHGATPAVTPRAQPPHPVDFDAARPQAAQPAAVEHDIELIEERDPPALNEVAKPDEADLFNGEFGIEAAAPRLAANEVDDEEPADRTEDDSDDDAVDIDVITTMLERLAKEGPRLTQPSPEADLASFARSQRGQSAARA
jgi:hypothetical protein